MRTIGHREPATGEQPEHAPTGRRRALWQLRPTRVLGAPLHARLTAVPLVLVPTALAMDVLRLATGDPAWTGHAWAALLFALLAGVLSVCPGFVDLVMIGIRGDAGGPALLHAAGGFLIPLVVTADWGLHASEQLWLPLLASVVATAASWAQAWLGRQVRGSGYELVA